METINIHEESMSSLVDLVRFNCARGEVCKYFQFFGTFDRHAHSSMRKLNLRSSHGPLNIIWYSIA